LFRDPQPCTDLRCIIFRLHAIVLHDLIFP